MEIMRQCAARLAKLPAAAQCRVATWLVQSSADQLQNAALVPQPLDPRQEPLFGK